MKIKILVAGLIVALGIGWWLLQTPQPLIQNSDESAKENTQEDRTVMVEKSPSQPDKTVSSSVVPVEKEATRVVDKQKVAAENKVRTPREIKEVWVDINPTDEIETLRPESPYVENIKAIEFADVPQFKALNQGDKITINLPDNTDIAINIDSNEFQNEGIRTWSGNFELEGEKYPVTFTFGKSSILGFIGHPKGAIKVEGKGSTAWIYEVPPNHGFD
ncbi:hypothetical protein [Vibrio proteolyticus]